MNLQSVDYDFKGILPEQTDLFFKNTMEVYADLSLSRNSHNGVPMLESFFMQGEYYFLIFASLHKEDYRKNAIHLTGDKFKQYMDELVKENLTDESNRMEIYDIHQHDIQKALNYKYLVYTSGSERNKTLDIYNPPLSEVW